MNAARWALVVLCASVASGAVVYAVAQAPNETVVRAQKFELLDADGTVKAVLGQVEDGNPAFVLYGSNGERRVALRVMGDDTARLHLFHRDGTPRAWMGLEWTGRPSFQLFGEDMRARTSVGIQSDGSGHMDVMDEKAQIEWSAP